MTESTTFDDIVGFGGSAPPVQNPDKNILGGKGLGLQEMGAIGIAVPPGFTLTTQLCQEYQKTGDLSEEVWARVKLAIQRVEKDMGRKFGDPENPLLVSCRSGAAISMPGMMDTVLNVVSFSSCFGILWTVENLNLFTIWTVLIRDSFFDGQGLNKQTVEGLAKNSGNRRFAFDSYRRLLDMFGDVVLGVPHEAFEAKLEQLKKRLGVSNDLELSAENLEELCDMYYSVYKENDKEFPQDAYDQVRACIKAVFGSWDSERAVKYREIHGITSLLGTACNIQTMVFGNLGSDSGTGVAFSRDPGTGEKKLKGEYLVNAQGEDVVAGIRTPEHIDTMANALPEAYKEFIQNVEKLENHFKDMQDVEFTVEQGKLWMLQCRSGKRTGHAAIKIAVDLVREGLCTPEQALLKVEPDHIKQVLHPTFSQKTLDSAEYKENIVAIGLAGT
jgi:pyruvate,orthophosphate dikinase